jgi:hypothetical protein
MSTPQQTFRRTVRDRVKPRAVVAFELNWEQDPDEVPEGEEPEVYRSDVFHATQPSNEKMFLIAAMMGDEDKEGLGEAAGVMELFRDALPADEYRTLKERLADPDDDVDIEMLGEVIQWVMSQWAAFPTQQSSTSSRSQGSSGGRSTGRVRGAGSTR